MSATIQLPTDVALSPALPSYAFVAINQAVAALAEKYGFDAEEANRFLDIPNLKLVRKRGPSPKKEIGDKPAKAKSTADKPKVKSQAATLSTIINEMLAYQPANRRDAEVLLWGKGLLPKDWLVNPPFTSKEQMEAVLTELCAAGCKWSMEEDDTVRRLVAERGGELLGLHHARLRLRWAEIAKYLPGRNGKQCR